MQLYLRYIVAADKTYYLLFTVFQFLNFFVSLIVQLSVQQFIWNSSWAIMSDT